MTKLKFLALTLLGLGLPAASWAQNHPPEKIAAAMMNLNASVLRNPAENTSRSPGNLWSRMRQDFRMSEVNPEIVRRHENYFATRSAYFNRTLERSRPYLYHILSEVEKRNMPAEIALLPFIESAFVTKARSRVGASGLWQFMPATGRQYGLAQNNLYDARHDVYAATDAALNYLQYLHNMFGDWPLALAAYNWGEGNVSRAVSRARSQGLNPVYENLRMPDETRNYVPKLLAVRNLVTNPQVFGLTLSHIENKPYFQAVTVTNPLDINAITRLANISHEEFEALNPSAKVPVFLPENGQRKLLLPVGAVNAFERNLRNSLPEALLSYDILHTESSTTLSSIAERTGMNVDDLRRANGLTRNNIGSGSRILVARGTGSTAARMVARQHSAGEDPLGGLIRQTALNNAPQSRSDLQVARNTPAASVPPPSATKPAASVQTASRAAQTTAAASATPPSGQPPLADRAAEQPAVVKAADNHPVQTAPGSDPLMALAAAPSAAAEEPSSAPQTAAADSDRTDAAALVRASLAQTEAEENRRLAAARAAAERNARQEQARAARTAAPQRTASHKVQAGETLSSIARRYNINMAELKEANNLRGNNIRPGQVLRVTAAAGSQTANRQNSRSSTPRHADNRNDNRRSPQRETAYTVRSGDTLQSIARRHNVSVNELKRNNNLRSNNLRPGQRLRVNGA